jgi:hypothetical protein
MCVAERGHMSKDVGIRIRVERELRDAFQRACDAESRPASDLLREFMRTYALNSVNGLQIGLFVSEPVAGYARATKRPSRLKKDGRPVSRRRAMR